MLTLRHQAIVLAVGLFTATSAFASSMLECSSSGYHYQYCRADTYNAVRLAHQQSKTSCEYGRSWGYDGRGIWVDNGCSAIFEYGYGANGNDSGYQQRSGRHHDNSGGVVAGVAALAILAAIADSSSSHHQHGGYNSGQDDNATTAEVPEWAVGGFNGSDDVSGTPIDINVDRGGGISGYYGHQALYGQWSGGRAFLGNRGYSASPTSHGIRLVSDDGAMVINLIRN